MLLHPALPPPLVVPAAAVVLDAVAVAVAVAAAVLHGKSTHLDRVVPADEQPRLLQRHSRWRHKRCSVELDVVLPVPVAAVVVDAPAAVLDGKSTHLDLVVFADEKLNVVVSVAVAVAVAVAVDAVVLDSAE